jgi:hypothetical protein
MTNKQEQDPATIRRLRDELRAARKVLNAIKALDLRSRYVLLSRLADELNEELVLLSAQETA